VTIPRYSRIEHERRFLVGEAWQTLCTGPHRLLRDRYITGTRLRLRHIAASDGRPPEYKLCKKYGPLTDSAEAIVNIYLTEDEYRLFNALAGSIIEKRRYHRDVDGIRYAVDAFAGGLSGLVIAEVETGDAAVLTALVPPPWAKCEITGDPWFRGGHLATVDAETLRGRLRLLAES
jgi:CYTH domain-containing protein